MKKLLVGITVLLLMASCGWIGKDKTITEDTSTDTDSQLDKGKQNKETDSLQNSEFDLKQMINDGNDSKDLLTVLPDPKRLVEEGNPTQYLRSLGFKGSEKSVQTMEGGKYTGNYSFEAGYKSITVHWENLLGSDEWDITIKNDDKALEDYYSIAKKQQGRGEYWEVTVSKTGDTVQICSNSD